MTHKVDVSLNPNIINNQMRYIDVALGYTKRIIALKPASRFH